MQTKIVSVDKLRYSQVLCLTVQEEANKFGLLVLVTSNQKS